MPEERITVPELGQAFSLRPGAVVPEPGWRARLPQPPTRLDWHNQRTALLMELNAALNHLPDDAAREDLIRAIREKVNLAPVDASQGALSPPG